MYRPDCDPNDTQSMYSRHEPRIPFIYSPPPPRPRQRRPFMESAWVFVAAELLVCAVIGAAVGTVVISAVHEAEKCQPQRTSTPVAQQGAASAACPQ